MKKALKAILIAVVIVIVVLLFVRFINGLPSDPGITGDRFGRWLLDAADWLAGVVEWIVELFNAMLDAILGR